MGLILRSRVVPVFLARARRLGVDAGDLIAKYNITEAEGETLIACGAFRSFARSLAARANDSLFGFHAALEMPPGAYGLIEHLVRNAPDVRALIQELARFSLLINAQMVVHFDSGARRLEQRIPQEPHGLGKQGNEFSLTHQTKIIRAACAAPLILERVFFAHPAPSAVDSEIAEFFGTDRIVYAAGFNGVTFSEDALDTPLRTADPSLLPILEEAASKKLIAVGGLDAIEEIRVAALNALEAGEVSAKKIAEVLQISERTLHRRLSEHELTFGELLDQLRYELALTYLKDQTRSVQEIAALIGFSDGRAFARAFRRWSSLSPLEWRAKWDAKAPELDDS